VGPGLALLLLLPATALQFPVTTFYRRMQFRRQRFLQSIEPIVAAGVTIGLAVAGAGYWSFVIGSLCGAWALALLVLRLTPYPLRLRYERGTLRQYVSFSTPLLIPGFAAIGVAGIGAFTLVGNLVQFTDQADTVLTQTLYPAVCAVQDRVAVLSEIFVKSNRLSLMWAVPFGAGMALFASDLVHFVLGPRWIPAVSLLEIMGLVTAVNHVGYNWGAFVKARGTTWPIAVSAVLISACTIAAGIPLMQSDGLVGLGVAFVIGALVGFVVRGIWIARFFTGVGIVKQLTRAFTPTLMVSVPILAGRLLLGPEQSLGAALAVFVFYVAATAVATWLTERPLIREATGYMLRPRVPAFAS
jgi:O-antigen/teichoic acid export membrane protein